MGLRIVAYTQMEEVDSPLFDDEGYPVGENVWLPGLDMRASEPFWPGWAAPLQYWKVYRYKFYKIHPMGSYDDYTLRFRRPMLGLVGLPMPEDVCYPEFIEPGVPFYELLCFSDCDGVIGTQVAQKLFKDFSNWHERAKKYAGNNGQNFMLETYEKLYALLRLAARDGALKFG